VSNVTDRRALFYDQAYAGEFPLTGKYARAVGVFKDAGVGTLLDVGCGLGDFGRHCRRNIPGIEVKGVDVSEVAVGKARENGMDAVRVDVGNERLPFGDDSFDGIFCGEVIEHVFDTDGLLEELRRVLRPTTPDRLCPLVLTTPNLASWYNRIFMMFGYQPLFMEVSTRGGFGHPIPFWLNAGHIRMFTYRAIRQFVQHHGFRIQRVYSYGINTDLGYGAKHKFTARTLNFLTAPFPGLCSDIVLVLTKQSGR
jgi:ubiquinone/menaquinone biosynthesis C-methylase UbiE